MNGKIFIIIVLAIVWSSTNAQTDINFSLQRFDNEKTNNFDIENNYRYILRLNPAFVHLQNTSDSLKLKRIIITDIFKKNTDGLYHFNEGDKSIGKKILAGGETDVKNAGTLFGFASFSKFKKYNVLQNYVINPKEYLPYIVGDTISKGEVNFKDYDINVGFGFNHSDLYYGIGISYKGVVSYKLIDPRFSSYLAQLKINLGFLAKVKNHTYSLRIFPEFDRQNVSVENFGQGTATYFQLYGLGQWNHRESKEYYTYSRLMTIEGASFDLIYATKLQSKKHFNYLFNISYGFNKVSTLESNNINLFESRNNYFKYNFLLQKKQNKFDLHFLLKGNNKLQKGIEYVYEHKKVNKIENLDDDFKVGSNKMYNYSSFSNSATLKFIYKLNSINNFQIILGANSFLSRETYFFPNKKILINNITPTTGFGFHKLFGENNLSINVKLSQQKNINKSFNLPFVENPVFIQQAHIPYIIESSNNYSSSSNLIYSYHLPGMGKLGFKLSAFFTNKTRLANQSYVIDNDKHKTLYSRLKLFYVF